MTCGQRLRFRSPVAGESDPNFGNVVLLLHMDDAGFSDVTGKAVSQIGTPTSVAGKFGNGMYTNDISTTSSGLIHFEVSELGTDFDFGSGDFTIETFAKWEPIFPDSGSYVGVLVSLKDGLLTGSFVFEVRLSTGKVRLVTYSGGVARTLTSDAAITANQFYHLAAVRNGDEYSIYIDGVKDINTLTTSGAIDSSPTSFYGVLVAGSQISTNAGQFSPNLVLDELRITKGVARYTGNFTPPTAPFPNS